MNKEYLFTSERLGFRKWLPADVPVMAQINADADVMEFFPSTKSYEETAAFIARMQKQMAEKGFCYYAADLLHSGDFIGFIGLSEPAFEAHFTPCVEIGWRLGKPYWGYGYASEGAARCLQYAFTDLRMEKIYAMAPKVNVRSEQVMKKTGMAKTGEFTHPLLLNDERLKECVLYEIEKTKE